MISLESSSNEPAYGYAFALAIQHHLKEFKERIFEKIESKECSSEQEELRLQDAISNIQAVNKFLLKKVLMHYKKEDISYDKPVTESLAFQLKHALLRPSEASYDVGKSVKTEELIGRVEAGEDEDYMMFSAEEREQELGEKLHVVLNNTLEVHKDVFIAGGSGVFDSASYYAGRYLRKILDSFKDLDFSLVLVNKVTNLVPVLEQIESVPDPVVDVLYEKFKGQLNAHLRLLQFDIEKDGNARIIKKLREQGNNHMANLAFAQAIQIYTNAVDMCTFVSREHTPQLLTNRAIAYIGLNCFPEAISDLNKAVQVDRTFTPAWTQLGYCHLYMGTSLTALKSYVMALKAASGEILPKFFPSSNKRLLQEYKETKRSTVLPQFAKRVMDAILLTEKRANQQNESLLETKRAVSNAHRILSFFQDNSSDTFGVRQNPQTESDSPNLRELSERANRARPNILNQDVAQNILASSGMEAVAITAPAPQEDRPRETNITLDGTTVSEVTRDTNQAFTTNDSRSQVRNLLNDLGDMIEGTQQTNNSNDTIRNGPAINSVASSSAESSTNRGSSRSVRDVLRGILPEGIGNALSQTLNSPGTVNHTVVHRQARPHNSPSSIFTRSRRSSSNQNSQRNVPDEDIDMPEPENLD